MNWTEERYAVLLDRLKVPQHPAAPAAVVSEALIEAECTKILECDGWRALRTDPVSDRTKGKGFGEIGMADHLYIRYAPPIAEGDYHRSAGVRVDLMWIEFKRPGEKAKKHQVAWHIRERARGALTLIAGEDFPATVEGFRQWYAGSDLARRALPGAVIRIVEAK